MMKGVRVGSDVGGRAGVTQKPSAMSSPYLILFVLMLSIIGMIFMLHLLPNERIMMAREHNLVRNVAGLEHLPDAKVEAQISVVPNRLAEPDLRIPPIQSFAAEQRAESLKPHFVDPSPDHIVSGASVVAAIPFTTPKATTSPATTKLSDTIASGSSSLGEDTVLLIICANRPEYLRRTLEFVVKYHPRTAVPILISQDGNSAAVNAVVDQAQQLFRTQSSLPFDHVHRQSDHNVRYENGYFKLADHFKFALNLAFAKPSVKRVIILEEDLEIAPDFYEFFGATKSLLDNDPQLFAVSAWNDNGFSSLVRDNQQIYRSDFFPGLGWMLTRKLWVNELRDKWPRAYWDDWLREPKQRQNRHVLRPEVCRTLHFGVHGVSNAQYSEFLDHIRLNSEFVPFTKLDLSYVSSEAAWDAYYLLQVRQSTLISISDLRQRLQQAEDSSTESSVRVIYGSIEEGSRAPNSYTTICAFVGCMNNVKAGVPRTAYKGIVTVKRKLLTIHLVPSDFR